MRTLVLLGSTGSIGTQAIDVVDRNRDAFSVTAIAAGGGNLELLADQAVSLGVATVAVADDSRAAELEALVKSRADAARAAVPAVIAGADAVVEVAGTPADVVLNGMTGSVGLRPTLAALEAGSTLALANKESLIVGGPVVLQAARRAGGTGPGATDRIVPVDSEHSALAQCLRGGRADEVRRLVLTASGGPFRGRRRDELSQVTPEQALAHPTWAMGPVVTTNSATMMNKALEVIEAHLLFGIQMHRIDVVVHPQSVVHSMVEFHDGSTLAQCSPPDMRLPIALGLSWPDRVADAAPGCDWTTAATWTFEPLDDDSFPAVRLARAVAEAGGTYPAVFNAANEEAVEAFFAGRLSFLGIVETVERTVEAWQREHPEPTAGGSAGLTLQDVLAAEAWARPQARELIGART